MESIIRKIFYKELGYHEQVPNDEEYEKSSKEYGEAYETLEKTLNKEQKKMLDEIFLCGGGVQGALEQIYFKEGFSAGLRLGAEVFCAKEEK